MKVIERIVSHYPEQALDKLEEVSYMVKHENTVAIEEFLKLNDERNYSKPGDKNVKLATEAYVKDSLKYFVVS